MSTRSLQWVHTALSALVTVLALFAAVLLAPGWLLIQPRDISTDGETLVMVRTATWPVQAAWGSEIERLDDGDTVCQEHGTAFYEARGYSPVRVDLHCDPLAAGAYLMRACWSPYVMGIPMRATCLQDDFTVGAPALPPG